jgi:microcystin-dependent protein
MDPYIGEIRMFAGTYAPEGWQMCDGTLLSISNYEALYALLGTQFGGNGTTTFGVPDFRGRIPVHQGTGPGLSPYVVGGTGGAEVVPLSLAQIPTHSHLVNVTNTPATVPTPGPAVNLAATVAPVVNYITTLSSPPVTHLLDTSTIGNSGAPGSPSHPNIMPGVVISFIIALVGIFPSRN